MVPIPSLQGVKTPKAIQKVFLEYYTECMKMMENPQGLVITTKQFDSLMEDLPFFGDKTSYEGWHLLFGVPFRVEGAFTLVEAYNNFGDDFIPKPRTATEASLRDLGEGWWL